MTPATVPSSEARFLSRIEASDFPCVAAKAALSRGALEVMVAGDLRCPDHDRRIVHQLQHFASDAGPDALFLSQVVLFEPTPALGEAAFESALWRRLQALHELDANDFEWDPSVSQDADSPQFSMSLGGRAFYVIGLHPGSSRPARRFHCAALVFNLHSQFETLRDDGRYDKLRKAIIDRDVSYSGSANPMLAVHGHASEARQYSGRAVGANWRCPFAAAASQRDSHAA